MDAGCTRPSTCSNKPPQLRIRPTCTPRAQGTPFGDQDSRWLFDPEAAVSDLTKCLGSRSLLPHRLAVIRADRGCFCHGSGHGWQSKRPSSIWRRASDPRLYSSGAGFESATSGVMSTQTAVSTPSRRLPKRYSSPVAERLVPHPSRRRSQRLATSWSRVWSRGTTPASAATTTRLTVLHDSHPATRTGGHLSRICLICAGAASEVR